MKPDTNGLAQSGTGDRVALLVQQLAINLKSIRDLLAGNLPIETRFDTWKNTPGPAMPAPA